ncbi:MULTISPECIES: phage portal protein [unclassified Sphingobium]|uniref:phage portal protein n=1 Tax=unclassified Sphingobium TaxID=2611147 RepID=UPI0022252158|nr:MULTISPECIES: phage portal protein [unclassified Sphingobium]MCW2382548.1 HK97 family phage portal protein [Sphingobium sp. B2D3B]MCW2397279.1 HK97 family phage portal protein [Sphingobium sp. B2D3C]
MKWFGRKAASTPTRPPLARAWLGLGWAGAGDWPQSYEAQLKASVIANPVAQRAVRLVAEAAGSAALHAVAAKEGDAQAALALVQRRVAGQSLIETLAAHVLLHGNGYAQIGHGADGLPATLYALRPERVTIEQDRAGWPVGYRYRAGESEMRYASEDAAGRTAVIHVKAINPADDHYGLGCLGAAAGAVAIHNAATQWNKALLDNAARPSGALIYAPGDGSVLAPEQFARLKAELEGAFQGADNAGRPMLLEGGLNWQSMSLSPHDMDFVALKAAAARDIALAFGVPPVLIGMPGDSTYSNYREANKALWRQSVLPLLAKLLGALGQGLRDFWPELVLEVDLNRLPALAEDRMLLWDRIERADFLSTEEKRAMLGLDATRA